MPMDGNKTSTVKNGLESVIAFTHKQIDDVGKYVSDGGGSGTYTPQTGYTLPATGANLVARSNQPIKSESAMVITVVGTDQDDAVMTGTGTLPALCAEGQSVEIVPDTADKRFKTISSVNSTNGVLGDGFDLMVLPDPSAFAELCFDEGWEANEGETVKQIYCKYDVHHNKRIRGDNTLTVSAKYTNYLEGLAKIGGRDVTMRVQWKDDGGNLATETWFYKTVRLSTPLSVPEEDDAVIRGEGSYGKKLVFS